MLPVGYGHRAYGRGQKKTREIEIKWGDSNLAGERREAGVIAAGDDVTVTFDMSPRGKRVGLNKLHISSSSTGWLEGMKLSSPRSIHSSLKSKGEYAIVESQAQL